MLNFQAASQEVVFTDNFSTNTNSAWTTDGSIEGSAWTVLRSGSDWGGRRNTDPEQLEVTNDTGILPNEDGWIFAMTQSSSFLTPYNTILEEGGVVTWTFNLRQSRLDPDGFDSGLFGAAFILAGENATSATNGNGYAVVIGQTGEDPVRLVSYTSGIMGDASITNLIVSNTPGLTDISDEYLSIRVTYNPCLNDQWELFVRNDGTTGFADPMTGTLLSQGTISNNVYTGIELPMMAAYWQGTTTANQTAYFDNVTVTASVKPVAEAGSYGPACTNDPDIILTGTPTGGVWSGNGVSGNNFDPSVGSQSITYTYTDTLGCSDNDQTLIIVSACLAPPEMHWVLLPEGQQNGSCTSATNCDSNIICYALRYTPNITGNVTSYTAGFLIDCDNGTIPVVSNTSCTMNSSIFLNDGCQTMGIVQISTSGNTGNLPVTQGVAVNLHQVCFTIPQTPIEIAGDGQISVSIDSVMGGGFEDEFPSYQTYTVDSIAECGLLPLKFLNFTVSRYADKVSHLGWTTTGEVNCSHFEVQRSVDGGKTFHNIGNVNATGLPGTINQYSYFDRFAVTGSNYYRLKQLDNDGQFQYSPIRSVVYEGEKFSVHAWPNPVHDELNIRVRNAMSGGTIRLVSLSGITSASIQFDGSYFLETLNLGNITPGVYTLTVTSSGQFYAEKIVVVAK